MTRGQAKRLYDFDRFRMDATERRLWRDREPIPLTQKAFDLLLALVERAGQTVEKAELLQRVWPDSFIEEGNLTQNIYTLRKVLGQTPGGQSYIETVPRRGYRFVAGVTLAETAPRPAIPPLPVGEPGAFVGRTAELRRLRGLLEGAAGGAGRTVFITGEPGMGKSALAQEFLERAGRADASLLLARGHCVEHYGASEAYLPFLDACAGLLGGAGRGRVAAALQTYAPTWCLELPAAFDTPEARERLRRDTIGATKERMLREMGDCLGALAADGPVVLLLEDLHWADPSSADLLRHLGRRAGGLRLLILGTYRPADLEINGHPLRNYQREMEAHNQCEEIALTALEPEAVAACLDARFAPNDFPPDLAALIWQRTGGHPLFATRLAGLLAERGDISRRDGRWALRRELAGMDLEVPASVLSLIRKRLEALDEEDRRALQYASVEGEEFLSTVVAGLLGVEVLDLEERLDRLDRAGRLIRARGEEELPDGQLATRYGFAHALYQNVLYDDLVGQRRVRLHRQAGELLARFYGDQAPRRVAAQLAMHFERGRDFARAVAHLLQVGDNAARVYANPEAELHYTRALGLAERLPPAEQAAARMRIYQKRGAVRLALSQFDGAIDDHRRMVEVARATGAAGLEHAGLNGLVNLLFLAHRLGEMEERAAEAEQLARRTGNFTQRLDTLAVLMQKHVCCGELPEAERLADEVMARAAALKYQPPLLRVLTWRGAMHFFQSEYARAIEVERQAHGLAEELRDGFLGQFSLFFVGLSLGNLGRVSEALATLHEAARVARRNGERFLMARLPNSLGWLYRELQDFGRAAEYDRQGVAVARENGVLEAEANSLINLGHDHMHAGAAAESLAAFHTVEDIFKRDEWFRWRYNIRLQAGQAEHWLARGDLEQAEGYARRLLDVATHYRARKYVAVAHRLLADIAAERGDLDEAEARLLGALALLGEHPAPLVAWKLSAALGRLRRRRGETAAARAAYGQAADLIEQIAANVDDEALRTTFLTSAAVREVLNHSKTN